MGISNTQHFVFLAPGMFEQDPRMPIQGPHRHMGFSTHYTCCEAYCTVLENPQQCERWKSSVASMFRELGLESQWSHVEIKCGYTEAWVNVLSISSAGELAEDLV